MRFTLKSIWSLYIAPILNLQDPGCVASDLVDGDLTADITTTGLPIDTWQLQNFSVQYSVCDRRSPPHCASISRVVMVVQTVVPVIRLNGDYLV